MGFPTSLFDLLSQRIRRTYDHRIKVQINAAGDPTLFPEPQIPRSDAHYHRNRNNCSRSIF